MKYVFPTAYGENVVLVPIDAALVPLISGVLQRFFIDTYWETREDYELGYNAFAEVLKAMAGNGLDELIESINRLYRLVDTTFNGTAYSAAANPVTGDAEISPAIPAAPPAAVPSSPAALRAQVARLRQLAENAATGEEFAGGSALAGTVGLDFDGSWSARLLALRGTTGGFFGIGATPVTLADLLQAGRVNTPADQGLINDGVEEILTAVSQGGSIGGVIADLLGTGADVATDGGVIAATIAASLSSTIQLGIMAGQLDRLIKALDGGGLLPPADNVLQTLKDVETLLS